MRQYKMQETKEVEKIICNKCGKEIIVKNGRRRTFRGKTLGVLFK